jgi:hypothetical protein
MPRITTPKGEKRYGWRFIVVGCGNFPTDMLRYDECFPVDETEARSMFSPNLERRTVRLERWSGHPNPPTEDRWQSQGWEVLVSEPVRGGFSEAADFWDRCKAAIESVKKSGGKL